MTVGASGYWRNLFENWPEIIPKKGQVVTTHGESIPFVNYLLSGGLLLIERDGPDATGMRKVVISYEEISMIKLAHPGEIAQFQPMGFQAAV